MLVQLANQTKINGRAGGRNGGTHGIETSSLVNFYIKLSSLTGQRAVQISNKKIQEKMAAGMKNYGLKSRMFILINGTNLAIRWHLI